MTDESFVAAAERWKDTVFRLAYSYTKNREDADDVTQEVLLALWREEKEFASQEHLRNWLVRVTLNRCTALFLAVMGLERKYRLPLLLHYFFGYAVREIGALLGLPENTVSTRLHRARAKLRDQLTEE